jgi:hypothetical protein
MRFRIDVSTLDGKMSYERDNATDALHVTDDHGQRGRQAL